MTEYEELVSNAELNGIKVKEIELQNGKEIGYYKDNKIIINSNMSESQKYCVLAEELGHHYTSYGNILDQDNINNKKQEIKARRWGYEETAGLDKIADAIIHGATNRYEIAETLNITDIYFNKAVQYLRLKYGKTAYCKGIMFYFEPEFGILKTKNLF